MYVIQIAPPLPDPNLVSRVELTITVNNGAPITQSLANNETHSRTFDGQPGQHVHVEARYVTYDGKHSPAITLFDGTLPDAAGNYTPNVPALGPVTFTA